MAEHASDDLGYPVTDVPESVASSPDSVIRFLVGELVRHGRVHPEHAERTIRQVVNRERQGSTLLGNGAAMPHSKSEVPSVIGIVGRSRTPLPWHGPDGVPVREVRLLLTPVDQPREAMRALKQTVAGLQAKA